MSLLDILASSLGNSSQQPGGQQGQAALIAAALAFVNSQPGGIMGLIQRFQQHGAGDVVQSWIGTGENKPISPDTLTNVLGQDNVGALAQKAGVSAYGGQRRQNFREGAGRCHGHHRSITIGRY